MIPLWTTYAGLVVAPSVWAINMQLGQVLPYVDCQTRVAWSAIATALATLIALASAWISWKGVQRTEPAALTFASQLSVLTALVIAFALFLQGAATLLLDACTR
jgi:hypothetical protein